MKLILQGARGCSNNKIDFNHHKKMDSYIESCVDDYVELLKYNQERHIKLGAADRPFTKIAVKRFACEIRCSLQIMFAAAKTPRQQQYCILYVKRDYLKRRLEYSRQIVALCLEKLS
jgi:hypothetical protein